MRTNTFSAVAPPIVRRGLTFAMLAVIGLTAAVAAIVQDGGWVKWPAPDVCFQVGQPYIAPAPGPEAATPGPLALGRKMVDITDRGWMWCFVKPDN
jgi:hypothetical protein